MRFCSLGSGSRGNAHVVCDDNTVLLFDCGFKLPTLTTRLAEQSLALSQINAIFISHEHTDHVAGIRGIQKASHARIFMSVGTARALKLSEKISYLHRSETIAIGDFNITPLTVPHDSAEPMQFIIRHHNKQLVVLTDIGHVTNAVLHAVQGADGAIIESNYDETMLAEGKYPKALQDRIKSHYGHLSNSDTAALFRQTKQKNKPRKIIGAHISQENNTPERVAQALQTADKDATIVVASQNKPTEWLKLS